VSPVPTRSRALPVLLLTGAAVAVIAVIGALIFVFFDGGGNPVTSDPLAPIDLTGPVHITAGDAICLATRVDSPWLADRTTIYAVTYAEAGTDEATLRTIDIATGEVKSSYQLPGALYYFDLEGNQAFAVVSGDDSWEVFAFDPTLSDGVGDAVTLALSDPTNWQPMALSARDGLLFGWNYATRAITVLDARSGSMIREASPELPGDSNPQAFTSRISPFDGRLYTIAHRSEGDGDLKNESSTLMVLDPETLRVESSLEVSNTEDGNWFSNLEVSELDGSVYVVRHLGVYEGGGFTTKGNDILSVNNDGSNQRVIVSYPSSSSMYQAAPSLRQADLLYAFSSGSVTALNSETGETLATSSVPEGDWASLVSSDGRDTLFSASDFAIQQYQLESGEGANTQAEFCPRVDIPAVDDQPRLLAVDVEANIVSATVGQIGNGEMAYLATSHGIIRVDIQSGEAERIAGTPAELIAANPASRRLFTLAPIDDQAEESDYELSISSAETGDIIATVALPFGFNPYAMVADESMDRVFVSDLDSRRILILDGGTGAIVGEIPDLYAWGLAVDQQRGLLYALESYSDDNVLVAIDLQDLGFVWTVSWDGQSFYDTPHVADDGTVFVVASDSEVLAIRNGEITRRYSLSTSGDPAAQSVESMSFDQRSGRLLLRRAGLTTLNLEDGSTTTLDLPAWAEGEFVLVAPLSGAVLLGGGFFDSATLAIMPASR